MSFKLVRKKINKPYDLSALKWVCEKCGEEKKPRSPHEFNGYATYCKCNNKKI